MFTNISWQDYIVAVTITLSIYYLIIGLWFYSTELKNLFSGKSLRKSGSPDGWPGRGEDTLSRPSLQTDNEDKSIIGTDDDEFSEVEELIFRLKDIIENASKGKYVPKEFKHYLHLLLREYPAIKTSLFRSSVSEFIVSECEKYDAVTLTEEEVDLLWNQPE